jgi:phenylpropionate dioxygenase-like ring-hydroxylating dioxygenase large terminal subunit
MTSGADGGAYGRVTPSPDVELTLVGPRTPAGELLRRYWQPVGLTSEVSDLPKAVRILGEDLVLFRDGGGRFGLLDPHCCHRGTSLYYGRIEADGVRCCYHGWLFDVEGRCLDQPCEPPESAYKDKVRQPWYPCREYHGLVFAYLGPPDRAPVFPHWDLLEQGDGVVVADGTSYGLGGGVVLDCNWLQTWENVMDPFHVFVLHNRISGRQFAQAMSERPHVSWEYTERGMRTIQVRPQAGGALYRRITEVLLPNVRIVPSVAAGAAGEGFQRANIVGWHLPIDDTHTRMYSLLRVPVRDGAPVMPPRARHGDKAWAELTEEEHQRMPGDAEAQVSQRPIAIHALEHLATSDRGVIMLRKLLRQQIDVVRRGEDPIGVARGPARDLVVTTAGNVLVASGATV